MFWAEHNFTNMPKTYTVLTHIILATKQSCRTMMTVCFWIIRGHRYSDNVTLHSSIWKVFIGINYITSQGSTVRYTLLSTVTFFLSLTLQYYTPVPYLGITKKRFTNILQIHKVCNCLQDKEKVKPQPVARYHHKQIWAVKNIWTSSQFT
jgi:hypothetical protein